MGRAKLNMELIRKEKSRNITFKKRKEGLMRKIHEFTTLCDVDACMIIYGPKQENPCMEAEIWPENRDEISRMINIYQVKSKDNATRVFALPEFFHERKKRVEDELDRMRKKNLEIKYPTWLDPMSHLSEMQLRKFASIVNDKLELVNSRMEAIFKGNVNDHLHHHHPNHIQNRYLIMEGLPQQQPHQTIDFATATSRLSGLIQRGVEWELRNQQLNISPAQVNPIEMHVPVIHYPAPSSTIHDQEHHQMHSINQNSMMMPFGGNASSIQCASIKYYHESTTGGGGAEGMVAGRGGGMLDNMVYNHPRPLARCYGPSVQPTVPYIQFPAHLMPSKISTEMQLDQNPPSH